LIECVVAGEVDSAKMHRSKISRILRENHKLAERLRKAKYKVGGQILWDFEGSPVRRVVLKLARGHAAYELNEPQIEDPMSF